MNSLRQQQIIREARDYWDASEPVEAGKVIFETIPLVMRPDWATQVLTVASRRMPTDQNIEAILEYGRRIDLESDPTSREALYLMTELSREEGERGTPRSWLAGLAYDVAKVIHTSRQYHPPFDHKAGWLIFQDARGLAGSLQDTGFADVLWQTLCNTDFIQLELPVPCHDQCPICLIRPADRLPRHRREWMRPPALLIAHS